MNKIALVKLIEDCRNAKVAGLLAVRDVQDNGTCNLDSPYVVVKPFGKKDEEALKQAGIHAYKSSRGYVVLGLGGFVGQANRNMLFAEAIAKHLSDCGYEAGVQYMMD
jgi:hypothetical protein